MSIPYYITLFWSDLNAADLSDTTVEALLEQADTNMYDAKENYHRQRSGASHA